MKRLLLIILTILISVSLTGCWSRYEPKTLALINSIIFDLDDNENFKVTLEAVNLSMQSGNSDAMGAKSNSITSTGYGATIAEAIANTSNNMEKKLFAGDIKVRLLSERFVKKDIMTIMDYLLRANVTDEVPLMVVIKGSEPDKVYSCQLGLSDTVGDYIESFSKTQLEMTSKSVFVTTLDFTKDYYKEGKQPVAGLISIVENKKETSKNTGSSQDSTEKESKIIYGGLAAFKNNKLVGYMDEVETRSYNFITNNIGSAIISIVNDNGEFVVMARKPKTDIKAKIKDDQIVVNVNVKTNISVIQANSLRDVSKIKPLKLIENDFNKQIEEEITTAIKKAQEEFKSDIFGFGVYMHKQHPDKWKTLKENWDDNFSQATIKVSVESTINRSGEIKHPFNIEVE